MSKEWKRIIISRTDSIGDVILTLPMAGRLKQMFPECEIIGLGRNYTLPIWEACAHVDECVSWDAATDARQQVELLKKLRADAIFLAFPEPTIARAAKIAGVKHRVATARRWHTFKTVNHRLLYSRKKSKLHEAQLNLKMLKVLGQKRIPEPFEIRDLYGFSPKAALPNLPFSGLKKKVLLHPKSKGSALEWPLEKYHELIQLLDPQEFEIGITGTAAERELMGDILPWELPHVHDLTGKLSLAELIAVVHSVDALVACSTGPLHMAAALGKVAVGLYTPKRPMHIGRWGPIGANAVAIADHKHPEDGALRIPAEAIKHLLQSTIKASSK